MAGLVGVLILVALVYALTVAQFSGEHSPGTPEDIAARIAPVGSVTPTGTEPAAAPAPAAHPKAADEGPGVAIYRKACIACHKTGEAGAPKFGDKAAWEPRIAQGLDQLLQTAIAGKGAMPPRGTCMACTDEDLKLATEYLLVQVGYEPAGAPAAAAPREAKGMARMAGMDGMDGYLYPGDQGEITSMSGMAGEISHPSAADLPRVKSVQPRMDGMSGMPGAPAAKQQPGMR